MSYFTASDYPPTQFPASTFVAPEGPVGAAVMIIGEAPGEREDQTGRPFVGPAGNLLNGFLRRAGLDRDDVYITNVIKYRPPGNKITTADAKLEIANNLKALQKEIKLVKPRVIVPMGNTALHALGIDFKIGECRGFVIRTPWGKVIPTWHPAYIFRQQQEMVTAQMDWHKIAKHSKTVTHPVIPEDFELNPTIEDVERIGMLIANKVQSGQQVRIGLDLETEYIEGSPLNTPIKLVGLGVTESKAMVIPFVNQDGSDYWQTEDELLRAITVIGNILENPNVTLIVHNALFDILVLMNHGFKVRAKVFCTQIAQSLIYFPSKHSLNHVASIYTDFPPWKLTATHDDQGFRYYNARDCIVLHYVYAGEAQNIIDNQLVHVTALVMDTIVPTCQMMLNGIAIDRQAYNEIKQELEDKLEQIRADLCGLAADPNFNPDAPNQVADLLFTKLKLRSGVKTKGGKKSTSQDVLNRLSLRYPDNEVVKAMQDYRHFGQQYKTFIKNLYIHVDDRVHSQFKLDRAASGRYSSAEPNLQNLPSRQDQDGFIRGLYRVKPGRMIVTADYSQLELMIFAELAGDDIWKLAFKNGDDVHAINGEALLGAYDPKYRTFVKNFIYGLIYGSEGGEVEKVAPKELIERISVPEMMGNLKKTHPALFTYRQEIEEQVDAKKWVANAFGRRRWFPKKELTKADYRSAYNHPIQGTAADIMHACTPRIHENLDPEVDMLILQLHDAFYIETDERQVDRVAAMLKSVMEGHIVTPVGYEFDLTADVEYGISLAKKDLQPWN